MKRRGQKVWAVTGPRGDIGYHAQKQTAQMIARAIRKDGGSAWVESARMPHARSAHASHYFLKGARRRLRAETMSEYNRMYRRRKSTRSRRSR